MATKIWVNFAPCNGFLLDGAKPLPEPIFIYHQWSQVTYEGNFPRDTQPWIIEINLKNYLSKISFEFLPGMNELIPVNIKKWLKLCSFSCWFNKLNLF